MLAKRAPGNAERIMDDDRAITPIHSLAHGLDPFHEWFEREADHPSHSDSID